MATTKSRKKSRSLSKVKPKSIPAARLSQTKKQGVLKTTTFTKTGKKQGVKLSKNRATTSKKTALKAKSKKVTPTKVVLAKVGASKKLSAVKTKNATKPKKSNKTKKTLSVKKTYKTKKFKRVVTPVSKPATTFQFKAWMFLASFGLGIFLILASGFYLLYRQTILSFKVSPSIVAQQNLRGDLPLQVKMENLGLTTSVVEATIKNGIWETSETAATHLSASARPAEGGNIVIYAHNKKHLFAALSKAKVGDKIVIETANKAFEYQVITTKTVTPDQIEAVLPTAHEVLTLYTCTGFLDSLRFIVQATPVGVKTI